MGTLKLLDCTLRDGGYVNDWNFGQPAMEDMVRKLEQTKVEILELGFIKDEPYNEDRTVFNDIGQVKKLIPHKVAGIEYAVMAEVVNPLPLPMRTGRRSSGLSSGSGCSRKVLNIARGLWKRATSSVCSPLASASIPMTSL